MDGDTELLPHGISDRRRRAGGRLGALLLDERQDLVGALVRAFRPPWAGQQPWQPGRRESRLGRIERLAADPKGGRHLGHRTPLDPMPTKHLVLDLHAIPPIEERWAREGLVLDGVGTRMERASSAERGDLRILRAGRAAPNHGVRHNTSIPILDVKRIVLYTAITIDEHDAT